MKIFYRDDLYVAPFTTIDIYHADNFQANKDKGGTSSVHFIGKEDVYCDEVQAI